MKIPKHPRWRKNDNGVWYVVLTIPGRFGWVACLVERDQPCTWRWHWERNYREPRPGDGYDCSKTIQHGACGTLAAALKKAAPGVPLPKGVR